MRTPSQHDYAIEILFDLTPGNFDIPLDWTTEQADRFVTILGHLEEFVWSLYGEDIMERYRVDRILDQLHDDDRNIAPSQDDDIPF